MTATATRHKRFRPYRKEPAKIDGFKPAPRGKIELANTPTDIQKIAPESPRPIRLLDGLAVVSKDSLTAGDQALHELLIAEAYKADPAMKIEKNSISAKAARMFLGGVRRDQLEDSLWRLTHTDVCFDKTDDTNTRRWGAVPMVVAWQSSAGDKEETDTIHYMLPEPVKQIMGGYEQYRYLELAAVARMRSKYGIRLYRRLLTRTMNNHMTFEIAPQDLAEWIGYNPPNWHYGTFRSRALDPAIEDLHGVTRFAATFTEIRGRRRGIPVEALSVQITMKSRSYYTLPTRRMSDKDEGAKAAFRHIIRADVDPYKVSPKLFIRGGMYWRKIGLSAVELRNLWDRAVQEALRYPDEMIEGWKYRRKGLLDAIAVVGTDNAAWALFDEEARNAESTRSLQKVHITAENGQYRLNGERMQRLGLLTLKPLPATYTAEQFFAQPSPVTPAEEAAQLAASLQDRTHRLDTIVARTLDDAMPDITRLLTDLDRPHDGRLIAAILAPRSWMTHSLVDTALRVIAGETGLDDEIAEAIADILAMPVAA